MPSDKTELIFSRRNKKRKLLFTTLIVFELILAANYLPQLLFAFSSPFLISALILVVQTALVAWILDFDLRLREMYFFLSIPLIYIVVSIVVLQNISSTVAASVLFLILGVGYYILLAALNIINVSTIRPIPLRKAALSSLFFIGMVASFLFGWRLLELGQGIYVLGWLWLEIFLFSFSFLYLASETPKVSWLESFVFGWVSFQLLVLINLWPGVPIVSVLALVGWDFVLLGVLYHHINRNLTVVMKREYLLFSVLLLGVFFLL